MGTAVFAARGYIIETAPAGVNEIDDFRNAGNPLIVAVGWHKSMG
jgi:hypothetical protein